MTEEVNQVTTVMSVTELPRLGGLKADTDFLSVKDLLKWQEIFNQKRTLNIEISIANRNTLLTNRVKCQIYIRLIENEIIQKGEMDNWLETTDHETFFDILIRLWREAELQIPQHDAIIAAIRKLNLNISTQRADSGFTFMASVLEILLNFGEDPDDYFNEINSRSLINHFNDRLSAPPPGSSSSLIGFYEQLLKASKSGEYINKVPKTFLEWMENFKTAVKKRVAVILEAGLFTARENPAVSMASTTQVVLAPRSLSRDRSRSRDRARDRYKSPPRTKLDCSLCGRSNHSREQCYLKSHPQANHEDVPWRESKTGKRLRRLNYKTLPNRTALDASGRWVEWSRENHTPLRDSSRHNDNRTNADRESSYKPSRPIDNERGSDRESHRDPRRRDNLKDRDRRSSSDTKRDAKRGKDKR